LLVPDEKKRGVSVDEIKSAITTERLNAVEKVATDSEITLQTGIVPSPSPSGAPTPTTDTFKNFLEEKDRSTGMTRLKTIQKKMYEVATSDNPRNIAAATFLVERGYGKAKLHEEDRAALAKGGVQLVYIEAPKVPMAEKRKELPAQPDFIDAEFKDDNDE